MSTKPTPLESLVRVCFVLYTLTLLIATHWPKLTVKGPIERTDLLVHLAAFGLWTTLLGLTGWLGFVVCRYRRTLVAAMGGISFGILDETTQPLFKRVFDWSDVAADIVGAILASLLLLVFWTWRDQRDTQQPPDSDPESMDPPRVDARS
ncbi:MAG: VanZ family protein [Phycisphaerales bacterium]|nr:VanZ family protein [Phycisphaerales bacterium]